MLRTKLPLPAASCAIAWVLDAAGIGALLGLDAHHPLAGVHAAEHALRGADNAVARLFRANGVGAHGPPEDANHAFQGVPRAELSPVASGDPVAGVLGAVHVGAPSLLLRQDAHHARLGVLGAEHRLTLRLAAEAWLREAASVDALPGPDVHHAGERVGATELRLFTPHAITRALSAILVGALFEVDVNHALERVLATELGGPGPQVPIVPALVTALVGACLVSSLGHRHRWMGC